MITVNKELEYDVYLGDWGIDLTSCFYEYNNQYQKVMSWNEECDGYNEEHFIESVEEFINKHPNINKNTNIFAIGDNGFF